MLVCSIWGLEGFSSEMMWHNAFTMNDEMNQMINIITCRLDYYVLMPKIRKTKKGGSKTFEL